MWNPTNVNHPVKKVGQAITNFTSTETSKESCNKVGLYHSSSSLIASSGRLFGLGPVHTGSDTRKYTYMLFIKLATEHR